MQLYSTRGRRYQIRLFWELLSCKRCGGAVELTVDNERDNCEDWLVDHR